MTINTRPDSTSSNIAVRGPSPSITIAETTGSDNVVLQLLQDGLPLSSEGAEFRYESSTGNTYLRSGYSAGSLYLGAGSSSAAQIQLDSSGRTRFLSQPMFSAARTGGGAVTGEWGTYNQIASNVGSHFNGTTGRFTAPIAGRYYFAAGGFGEWTYNPVGMSLRINGSHPYGAAWRGYTQIPNQQYTSVGTLVAIWSLNANDYVSVFTDNGAFHGNASQHFSGFLLG